MPPTTTSPLRQSLFALSLCLSLGACSEATSKPRTKATASRTSLGDPGSSAPGTANVATGGIGTPGGFTNPGRLGPTLGPKMSGMDRGR